MKTPLIMLISVTLSLGVSAQRKGYYRVYTPRVYVAPVRVGVGFGYGYPYFGYPYYTSPYGYPYYDNGMPYRLSLQIESIKEDYRNKIRDARYDNSLSHSQKREEIRDLKTERDKAIIDAKINFNRPHNYNNNYPSSGS